MTRRAQPPVSYAELMALRLNSEYWAVFNGHINNAGDRAFADVRNMYPPHSRGLRKLTRMRRSGIMEIFTVKQTAPMRAYTLRCFAYANGITITRAKALLKCESP